MKLLNVQKACRKLNALANPAEISFCPSRVGNSRSDRNFADLPMQGSGSGVDQGVEVRGVA